MQVQKLLAGVRDRGGTCAVVECSTAALADRELDWLEVGGCVQKNSRSALHPWLHSFSVCCLLTNAHSLPLYVNQGLTPACLMPLQVKVAVHTRLSLLEENSHKSQQKVRAELALFEKLYDPNTQVSRFPFVRPLSSLSILFFCAMFTALRVSKVWSNCETALNT